MNRRTYDVPCIHFVQGMLEMRLLFYGTRYHWLEVVFLYYACFLYDLWNCECLCNSLLHTFMLVFGTYLLVCNCMFLFHRHIWKWPNLHRNTDAAWKRKLWGKRNCHSGGRRWSIAMGIAEGETEICLYVGGWYNFNVLLFACFVSKVK